MNYVTAGVAVKHFQISYVTLKRWKDEGRIKVKVYGTRKILYDIDSLNQTDDTDNRMSVIYARVSTTSQKHDLENQIHLASQYMICNGVKPDKVYQEIASGINDDRPILNQLIKDIADRKIKKIYITYKDRLTRFGFGYFKTFCAVNNIELFVIDELETTDKTAQQELTEDLISVIHHYSTKLDSSKRKQMKEITNMLKTDPD